MATLLEAEVKVIILLHCLLVFRQYLVQVVPDLGLGVKFSDPGIDKEVGSLIKVKRHFVFFRGTLEPRMQRRVSWKTTTDMRALRYTHTFECVC